MTYIVEGEAQERLSALAERYKKINGWNEKEILQFAVTAFAKSDIEIKLKFLEKNIERAEKSQTGFSDDGNTFMEKKENGRKWSRDWERFEWEEIRSRLAEAEKGEYKNEGYGVGISKEEFLEFFDWLHENMPEQYYKILLSLQLTECGLSDEEVAFWLAHPDVLKMVLDKIKD